MRMRRRGLTVVLSADTDKDDKTLGRYAKRFNKSLSAGFGRHQLTFELPEDIVPLRQLLKCVYGSDEGDKHTERLVAIIKAAYQLKRARK